MTTSSTVRAPRRVWREVTVTVGALLGALCITLAVLGGVFGIKPLVFTSGSMSPEITTGALAFAKETPAADLLVGDVVSVLDVRGVRVTHRVVTTEESFGSTSLVLKGDANATADVRPYRMTTADRVLFDIPGGGYAVTWMATPAGLVVAGLLLGLVLLAAFSPSQRPRHVRATRQRSVARAALAVSVLGLSSQASIQLAPTEAFWIDSADAASGVFSTVASIPTPTAPVCTNDGTHVDGAFTGVGTRYRYEVTAYRNDTTTQVGSASYYAASPAHLPYTDFATKAAFQATGRFNFTYRIRSVALNTTTWLSPTFIEVPFRFSKDYSAILCGNDTSTSVSIDALSSDSGASASDFSTNVASNTLTGSSTAGDSSTVVIKRNGVFVVNATVNATTGAWTASVPLTEGSATYTAEATDYIGNTATATRAITLDTTPPTAGQSTSCSSPGNAVAGVAGATWCKVTSLPVTGVFSDSGSGIASREINNNNAGWTAYTGPVGLQEFNGRIVQVRTTDVAGNVSAIDAKTYYIDGTAPVLKFTAPIPGTNYGSSANLRNLVISGCGTSRVACGSLVDTVSGLSTTAPQWKLRRQVTGVTDRCLNAGSYTTTCTSTYAVTVTGSTFTISSGSATTTTIYADKGANSQIYTLTITLVADQAGNSTSVTSVYND